MKNDIYGLSATKKLNEWDAKAYKIYMAEELKRQEEIKREKELANNPETFIMIMDAKV